MGAWRNGKTEGRRTREEGRWEKGERGKMDGKSKIIRTVKDLEVYQLSFDSAMEIFEISKKFPKEERYSLTDQIRRSSRSICASISEAWRKRKYQNYFVHKLAEAGQEAAETQTWLEFALACCYIENRTYGALNEKYEHIFAMLTAMERKADSFCK
ncbi:MAG: four helix bundle protein [Candidatus Omnitrophota bacterium]